MGLHQPLKSGCPRFDSRRRLILSSLISLGVGPFRMVETEHIHTHVEQGKVHAYSSWMMDQCSAVQVQCLGLGLIRLLKWKSAGVAPEQPVGSHQRVLLCPTVVDYRYHDRVSVPVPVFRKETAVLNISFIQHRAFKIYEYRHSVKIGASFIFQHRILLYTIFKLFYLSLLFLVHEQPFPPYSYSTEYSVNTTTSRRRPPIKIITTWKSGEHV